MAMGEHSAGAVAGRPGGITAPDPPGLSAGRIAASLAVGLPIAAVFLWLAARGVDVGALGDALAGASAGWVALVLAAMAGLYACQAERWRRIAASETRLGPRRALAFVVGGIAANNVIPGRPGEPLRGWWLARAGGVPFGRGLATVVVDRCFDVLVLVAILLGTLPLVPSPAWLDRLAVGAGVLGAVAVLALAGAWVVRRRRAVPERRAGGLAARLLDQALQFVDAVPRCLTPARALVAVLLSVGAFGSFAVGAWAAAQAVGVGLSPAEALFITAVLNLGSAIPSSPGFVGTYQWLAVAGLGLFAVPATAAFAFAVVLHAAWFVPTTLIGVALAVHPAGGLRPAARGWFARPRAELT